MVQAMLWKKIWILQLIYFVPPFLFFFLHHGGTEKLRDKNYWEFQNDAKRCDSGVIKASNF